MSAIVEFPAARRFARPSPVETEGAEAALSDWLQVQTRILDYWIDRLVGEDADPRLIGVLHQHAAFLREANARR